MFPPHPTELLHTILRGEINEGDLTIDATAGNGHDTLFLAKEVGESGTVLAFDIQAGAIEATRGRLEEEGVQGRVSLFQKSHSKISDHAAPGSVKAIIFNLGFLPNADRSLTTQTPETLQALHAACGLLKPGGILATICYPGHPEGIEESTAVEAFFHSLPNHRVARYSLVATKSAAPFLLLARNGRKQNASIVTPDRRSD